MRTRILYVILILAFLAGVFIAGRASAGKNMRFLITHDESGPYYSYKVLFDSQKHHYYLIVDNGKSVAVCPLEK